MIVTRFAPSPTGTLHLGSARTALFNMLFAMKHNGKLLLRIEDTDRVRSKQEFVDSILSSLKWLGIEYQDQPIYQFARNDVHADIANALIKSGHAYHCYATQEELQSIRISARQSRDSSAFRSPWRDGFDSKPHNKPVIRLRIPDGLTKIQDLVQGEVITDNSFIEDIVLLRSDGTPTYQLSVVVDDHDMNISHIIRGDDHLTNSPKQSLIYSAMNWKMPEMAHIPLIHAADGTKLSKRHGAVNIESYSNNYLPEAMCNYLIGLGWHYGDNEIISMQEAAKIFRIENICKSPAKFDLDKLNHINSYYIRTTNNETLIKKMENKIRLHVQKDIVRIQNAISIIKDRAKILDDIEHLGKFYTAAFDNTNNEYRNTLNKEILKTFCDLLGMHKNITNFKELEPIIKEVFKATAEKNNVHLKDVTKCIRLALCATPEAPPIFGIISILGVELTIQKIQKIL